MTKDRRMRKYARTVRDWTFRRAPGLQRPILAGARRGYVPRAIWQRLHPNGVWMLHAPDGTPFSYDSTFEHDGLARHIVWTDLRDWERTTQPLLCRLAKQAEVFVDVGAYSGIYTLLACAVNPDLRAVAFEPNPSKLPQLRSNVSLNGLQDRVTIVGKALSCKPGEATLAIPADDSTASLCGSGAAARTVTVPVTTGDEALRGLPIGLVKIDVEGFEPEVLTGMARILTGHRPKIIAECLDQYALRRLQGAASAFGYRYTYHLDQDGLVPVGDFRDLRRCPNYLFTTELMTAG